MEAAVRNRLAAVSEVAADLFDYRKPYGGDGSGPIGVDFRKVMHGWVDKFMHQLGKQRQSMEQFMVKNSVLPAVGTTVTAEQQRMLYDFITNEDFEVVGFSLTYKMVTQIMVTRSRMADAAGERVVEVEHD